jgi:hypothetical protein
MLLPKSINMVILPQSTLLMKKYYPHSQKFETRISTKKYGTSIAFLAVFILSSFLSSAQSTFTISRWDYAWCTNTYPTPYETVDFSIIELSTFNSGQDGFTKNQTNKTIVIDLPAGFEFNTTVGTVTPTQSGGGTMELTGVSFVFNSVTRITVTLSTANTNNYLNTLDFNNFQIRATATGLSGNIVRNGGTLEIEQLTTYPSSSQPLGILSSGTPFVYTGSSVTQASTANVTQFSINQEILRIKISGTGNCGETVTSFSFNTDGGNGTGSNLPTSNISQAKVYYTGSSSTFATTSFFGSVTSPNGAFTITGSQELVTNDSYFWLTYDVPGDANTASGSNLLDAQLVNYVLSGVTRTDMTTPAPTGSRPIIGATFYYSRFSGSWNTANIWSATDNGASCSCEPNGSGVVIIDTNHTVSTNVTRTVDVIQVLNAGTLSGGGADITVNSAIYTYGSGKFTLTGQLNCVGNMFLAGSGASTCAKIIDINGDCTVGAGTSLTATGGVSGGADQNIYIGGNIYLDGTISQTGAKDIVFDVGAAFLISGQGTMNTTRKVIMNAGSKQIKAGSNLTINSDFYINGAYTLTNNATVSINGNMDASSATSEWNNAAGSTLNYAGTTKMFITNGTLICSATTNTVNYNATGNQTIIYPMSDGIYNHLTLSGSGTKTLSASVSLTGDWTNNTTFAHNNMGVTFTGTAAESVTGSSVPTFYNLIVDKSAGTLTLNLSPIVSNTLTLTAGALALNSNTLTVNNSATSAIVRTAGYVISEATSNASKIKWNMGSTTGAHVFPFGTSSGSYIPFTFNLTAGTIGNVSISTYPTNTANSPFPSTVTHVNSTAGVDNSANTVDRFWQIDKDGASGTATMTFSADAAEVGSITTLRAQRWVAAAIGWEAPIAGQSNTGTTATVSGVTNFSPWTLSGNNSPLPVELVFFTGEAVGKKVHLNWQTATEKFNSYFEIQKSKDGVNFSPLAQIPTKAINGNSTTTLDYDFEDVDPFEGVTYYRLKQVDTDGSSDLSQVVAVNFSSKKDMTFTLFPNPNKGEFVVDFAELENNHSVTILVYDNQGKKVYESVFQLHSGTNMIEVVPTEKIAPGLYTCVLVLEGVKKEIKVVVHD